jgi:hypothetical protein
MWVAALCSTLYYLKDDDVSIHFFNITHIYRRQEERGQSMKVAREIRKERKEGKRKNESKGTK